MYINKMRGLTLATLTPSREVLSKYINRRAVVVSDDYNDLNAYRHNLKIGSIIVLAGTRQYPDENTYIFDWRSTGGKKTGGISHKHIFVEPLELTEFELLASDIKEELTRVEERILFLKEVNLPTYERKSYLAWKLETIKKKGEDLISFVLNTLENIETSIDLAI